jgi:hypothetical protein
MAAFAAFHAIRVNMLRTAMRIYSYLYHLVLCLFLVALGAIALASPGNRLHLPMLPWEEPALRYWVFFGGLVGTTSLFLAYKGKLRLLFRLWTVAVVGVMAYGFFLSRYAFGGASGFLNALAMTLGALLAAWGSWLSPPRRV